MVPVRLLRSLLLVIAILVGLAGAGARYLTQPV
jgi:hypothetical protein